MKIAEILFESQEIQWSTSPLFAETYKDKVTAYPGLAEKVKQFISTKQSNPLSLFGHDDRPFKSGGFFDNAVPKIRKAHLTPDISIVYRLSRNELNLYGLFTHDDLGVGQPGNVNRQRAMATKFAHAGFVPGLPSLEVLPKQQSSEIRPLVRGTKVDYTPRVRPEPTKQSPLLSKDTEVLRLAELVSAKWPVRGLDNKMRMAATIKDKLELIRSEAANLANIRDRGARLYPNQVEYLNGLKSIFNLINP